LGVVGRIAAGAAVLGAEIEQVADHAATRSRQCPRGAAAAELVDAMLPSRSV
jgi:hypothetical protein